MQFINYFSIGQQSLIYWSNIKKRPSKNQKTISIFCSHNNAKMFGFKWHETDSFITLYKQHLRPINCFKNFPAKTKLSRLLWYTSQTCRSHKKAKRRDAYIVLTLNFLNFTLFSKTWDENTSEKRLISIIVKFFVYMIHCLT